MKDKINYLLKSGFIGIMISNTLVKLLVFASSIFLPRFLSVNNFGIFSYTENIFNYFLIINGIGISNSILKYCSNNDSIEDHKAYLDYILRIGIVFDIFLIIVMFVFSILFNFEFEYSQQLFQFMLLIPILSFVFECIQLYLRSNFENSKYSILTFSYSFFFLVLQILFAIYFAITGVVIAKYISLLMALNLGGYFLYRTDYFKITKSKRDSLRKKEIIKYGLTMLVGNFASIIVTLNDNQVFNNYIKDSSAIAMYKVGSLPLQIMLFFTNSIIIFIIPIFVKHSSDKNWIKKNYKLTMIINLLICIVIHFVFYLLAEYFILIFYGSKYIEALPYINRFLCISFVLSTLRNIPGNLLAILGHENYNLIINIITVAIHFILQILFISNFGTDGVGIALFISYLVSGILLFRKMYITINDKEKERTNI